MFLQSDGEDSTVELALAKEGSVEDGYVARIVPGDDTEDARIPSGRGLTLGT